MEYYYSAIKKNAILPFVATWMDLQSILSERERQMLYDVIYIWNLKNNTDESVYKTETESQTQKTNSWLPKGRGREGGTSWKYRINRYKLYI